MGLSLNILLHVSEDELQPRLVDYYEIGGVVPIPKFSGDFPLVEELSVVMSAQNLVLVRMRSSGSRKLAVIMD